MVFGKELVLALVLVTTGEPVEDGQQVPLAACRQVAVQMQLLDVAELPYYFRETDQEGYIRSDLEWIRGRYQRGRDFPRVEEVNLPPAEFCEQMRLLLRQREC